MTEEQRQIRITPQAAKFLMIAFLFLLVLFGGFVTGVVLKEPDICFLLAMGRWMVEHGQIPAADPFSYTSAELPFGHTYVVYQWLTELIFYGIQRLLGTAALVTFAGAVMALAFVVFPGRTLALLKVDAASSLGMLSLLVLAACTHVSVRPEIFSYLFTAILLEVIVRQATRTGGGIDWKFVGLSMLIVALWVNLHCVWVLAFILLGGYLTCHLIAALAFKKANVAAMKTTLFALTGCLAATLSNPYGPGIWPYVVHVLTDPINLTLNEMRPYGLESFKQPTFYPFLLFVIVSVVQFVKRLGKPSDGNQLFLQLLMPLGLLGVLKNARSAPIAALFMLTSVAGLPPAKISSFRSALAEEIDKLCPRLSLSWAASCPAVVALGAFLMASNMVSPNIPQSSAAFSAPEAAIAFLEEKGVPSGHLLNDPHFGNVMMWQMQKPPGLFVDSRYYMYDVGLMNDYWDMVLRRGRWAELLGKYDVAWVFLPSKTPLIEELSKNPQWHVLHADEVATICQRIQPAGR